MRSEGEGAEDDMVVTETVAGVVMQHPVPARVDVSGLLAISAVTERECSPPPEHVQAPDEDWPAFGSRREEDAYLSRFSA